MKKLLFLLFILLSFISYSQNTEIVDVKDKIVLLIDKYAYPKGDFQYKHKYKAFFEDNILILKTLKSDGVNFTKDYLSCDFSKSTQFHGVSYRQQDLSYINIFVNLYNFKKRKKWRKAKLVIRVKDPEKAEQIQNALKLFRDLIQKEEYNN